MLEVEVEVGKGMYGVEVEVGKGEFLTGGIIKEVRVGVGKMPVSEVVKRDVEVGEVVREGEGAVEEVEGGMAKVVEEVEEVEVEVGKEVEVEVDVEEKGEGGKGTEGVEKVEEVTSRL